MMRLVTTFFFSGLLRPAPGTWGSLAALICACILHILGGPLVLGLALIFVAAISVPAIRSETRGLDDPDRSEIVVDEVIGQWIAVFPVSYGAQFADVDILRLWPGLLAAFVLFRLFDIWKPGPIGRADRRGDVLGVVIDDIMAGVFAAVCVVVLAVIWHLFLI